MSTDEPTPPRPARPGPGVLLRRLAGVRESILDAVPGERARYTSMGGVVLGTAAIATIAMGVAMAAVFGSWTSPAAIGFTLIWGLFILNLDRWLMSTVIDRDGWERILRFLPRLVLAVAFGVIIAEPLLLGVYDSAIVNHIADERQREVDQLETALVRCNPKSGSRPADCSTDDVLSLNIDPDATQAQLASASEQAAKLRETVERDKDQIDNLEEKQRQECAGETGPGLSGRSGYGPRCRDASRRAEEYKRDNQPERNVQELARIDALVQSLSATLRAERADHAEMIDARIQERIRLARERQRTIGLMERFQAMDELVSRNGYVHGTQWALRIFFVLVDSLPVLVKLLSGRTSYDRVAAARRDREERAQALAERTLGYRDANRAGVDRYRIDREAAAARDRVSVEVSRLNGDTEEMVRRRVAETTNRILGQAATAEHPALPERTVSQPAVSQPAVPERAALSRSPGEPTGDRGGGEIP